MKAKWLNRNIITANIYYTLSTSEKITDFELKRLKVTTKFNHIPEGAGATTQSFTSPLDKKEICIVCLYDYKTYHKYQVYSLLVHEAVHVWQNIKRLMREDNPSSEFEAYSIQRICQELFYEFGRQTKKRK